MIYFDNNSTTKIAKEVLAKMNEVYQFPLNSSASHQLGRQGNVILEEARNSLKDLFNAQTYEVIFTGCSTEANNMVIAGCDADKILFCGIEHASIYSCRPQNKEIIEVAALKNGQIDLADLDQKLKEITGKKFLLCLMFANNETGAIQPIKEAAKLVHQNGGLIHCDLVQGTAKLEVNLEDLNVDFASLSAHKINGPQGVGALLMRKSLDIQPLLVGGKQEKSKRAGTTNLAGISGLGVACKLAKKHISDYQNVQKLRDFLESEITKIAGDNVKFISSEIERLPNTSYISLKNFDSQVQLINFDLNGICVSAGATCSSGTTSQSRVLKAMNIEPEFLSGAIRVSLGLENTKEEVEQFIKIWDDFYRKNFK
jgi:cysteine desulfurase